MSISGAPRRYTPAGFALLEPDEAALQLQERLRRQAGGAGGLPNYLALLAGSPLLYDALEQMTRLFAPSSLSVEEKQVVMLSASRVNSCAYCMAAHSHCARRQGLAPELIASLRQGSSLGDPRLESLRRFTAELLEKRGDVSAQTLQDFLAAGFTHEQALEIVLAAAIKTLTSYADKLARLPLDDAYAEDAWQAPADS